MEVQEMLLEELQRMMLLKTWTVAEDVGGVGSRWRQERR